MRLRRAPLLSIALLTGLGVATASAHATPPAVQKPAAGAVQAALRAQAGGKLKAFYAARDYRPLWAPTGRVGRQAELLLGYLRSADADGLSPERYDVAGLRTAIARARGGDPQAAANAELRLSDMFVRYVSDQKKTRDVGMIYADKRLKPKRLGAEAILRAAAFPKSFEAYVADMGWMSAHYVRLRKLAASADPRGPARARMVLNLDRARVLPSPYVSHVVVDASSGQLWYYQAGKQAGTMRVVVGARETQTPMLAGMLQWAILNPYWNIPTYLARDSIARKVLSGRSLASMKIEALSDWSATPTKVSPASIDWHAVAAGREEVRLRELPGPQNSMGRVKFVFPNKYGIYLHDTPDRALLRKDDRHFSNGCIRLEDAGALGRWLMQKPLERTKGVEQAVQLPVQVPVYLTYLTATPTARGLAFRKDVYGRDGDAG